MAGYPLAPKSYLDAISTEAAALGAAAAEGLALAVPSCPGWDVAELVGHVGLLHRRVAAMADDPQGGRVDVSGFAPPPDGRARLRWFDDGATALVAALRAAGPERVCWTLDEDAGETGFWFRRMAQETQMHRVDAEGAVGRGSRLDPVLAADGVDELFAAHLPRRLRRRPIAGLKASLLVVATDVDGRWQIDLTPDAVRRGAGTASTAVEGAAAALLSFFWNRGGIDSLSASGDVEVLKDWSTLVAL